MFGQPDFNPDLVSTSPIPVPFQEQLEALQQVIREGKVRHVGVSNETPYGLCRFVELAQQFPDLYPRIVSIQNSYSLVVRKDFEAGLGEACYHHNVALLAYSPLAGGVLSGKYADPNNLPKNARLRLFPGFMDRYLGSQNEAAVREYTAIAKELGITPAELALSWCYHRNHVSSTIIGATSLGQLDENIRAYDIRLDESTLEKINSVYKRYTDPTKGY
jgi:aryl-alcohol dehydrogenase-like predicted oxidoreductase